MLKALHEYTNVPCFPPCTDTTGTSTQSVVIIPGSLFLSHSILRRDGNFDEEIIV